MTMIPATRFINTIPATAEALGAALTAMTKGFGHFQGMADKILTEEGLPANFAPDGWYSVVKAIAAFRRIKEKVGPKTLYQIGKQIPESAKFPPQIDNAHAALASIGMAYTMNHRNGDVGVYGFHRVGDKAADIHCQNPYPCAFDEGIITAMARRFEPLAKVGHDPASCREKGGKHCLYHVTW